jgi:hypothetical protein
MQKYLALTVVVFLMQSNALAAESFEGWPEDKVTVHCGAVAILNRYMNKSVDGQLPPLSEEAQDWWDKTQALFPDAATLRQDVTLAGQSIEADYLKASNNETNPKVTRKSHAGGLDLSCALYLVNKRIEEGEKALAQLDRDLVVANEISRREKAEASISFDEPPFVNIRKNESAATLDIYFSLGCNHCLLFLDQHLDDLIRLKNEGRLNLRFLEVPGLTPYMLGNRGVARPTAAAGERARVASRYAACAAMKSPHHFTNFVTRLIVSAKSNVPKIESRSWEYYPHAVASDFKTSSPFRSVEAMLEHAGNQFGISVEQCDASLMKERSEKTYAILKTLRETVNVPFYRFGGRYYHDAREHEQLMIDVRKYVDSMPVVSP